jgi:hypothetical protein
MISAIPLLPHVFTQSKRDSCQVHVPNNTRLQSLTLNLQLFDFRQRQQIQGTILTHLPLDIMLGEFDGAVPNERNIEWWHRQPDTRKECRQNLVNQPAM